MGQQESEKKQIDRKPVVAGQFYPSDSATLRRSVVGMLDKAARIRLPGRLVALIVPHAGYLYSGHVAAAAYKQMESQEDYERVFLIGSSHRASFEGASIYTEGNFISPLGTVTADTALGNRLVHEHTCFTASLVPHIHEHSLEVQLPFLQAALGDSFRLIPILIGTADPSVCRQIADALRPFFGGKNLFVISSDFSHYPGYEDANTIDSATLQAILTQNPDAFVKVLEKNEARHIEGLATSACGWTSILTLLYMTSNDARIKYTAVKYANSGDISGDHSRVVGYHAVAVSRHESSSPDFALTEKDKADLLLIARIAIENQVAKIKKEFPDTSAFSDALKVHCGAFVTIMKNNELRGCIGRFEPGVPLWEVVGEMAVAAATRDSRFEAVSADELAEIEIEISVLTPLRRILSLDEFELGKHGIYIKKGYSSGTFLPQVAEKTGWTKEEFVGHCSRDKAHLGWDGWKDAEIYTYEAILFQE